MKLIWIYGPPAAGKLTVAKELSKLTGYKIFDNHQTVDVLAEYLDVYQDSFWDLNVKIKGLIIDDIVKEGRFEGMIVTNAFAGKDKSRNLENFLKHFSTNDICFVRLVASKDILIKRVTNSSRKGHKIKDRELLEKLMTKINYYRDIPGTDTFVIDNTNLSPKDQAEMIVNHFSLKGNNLK